MVKKLGNWYNKHPKRINGIDLCGKILVLTEKAPEDTNFGGMKMVTIAEKGNITKEYRVMMTEQDVDLAVELYTVSGDGAFAFQPSEKNPEKYASVCKISKGAK